MDWPNDLGFVGDILLTACFAKSFRDKWPLE